VDGSSYIYRAYHAIQGLSNSQGLPTNAIFGFTRMLIKLIEDRKPEYLIMLFDSKGPTFRHKIYEKYKANRPPMPEDLCIQIPYIKEVTQGLNLPLLELEGYEADDLIGTLAAKAGEAGFSVVMVTGDKDFMQLVTENIHIWDPMKDKTITIETIRESFGLEPAQMTDVMGLSGDTSDNIPGVPGIGQKTAVSLIQTYGSIDHLYQKIDHITQKKQKENLIKFKDQAYLSRQLVKIDSQAPVEFKPENFSSEQRITTNFQAFQILEFRQLQQNYPAQSDLGGKNYQGVQNLTALKDLVTLLKKSDDFPSILKPPPRIP
jgi:DNA polymerase I